MRKTMFLKNKHIWASRNCMVTMATLNAILTCRRVSSIIPMMDKTQVNSDCEFYDIYRLLIFLTKCGPYDAMAPSQKLLKLP